MMFGWFSKRPQPPERRTVLSAVPVRNTAVEVREAGVGKWRLVAPLKRTFIKRYFGSKAAEKAFELDDLGIDVWNACDGRATVEDVIRGFAQRHRLNLREAEVSVQSFLQTLIRRNLLALIATRPVGQSKAARRQSDRARRRKK